MDLTSSLRRAVETDAGHEMFENVSNAVLEALDRSCYNSKLSKSDKAKFVKEIRAHAESIVYTLMVGLWLQRSTQALQQLVLSFGEVHCERHPTLSLQEHCCAFAVESLVSLCFCFL